MGSKLLNTLMAGCARSLGIYVLSIILVVLIFACSFGCGLLATPMLAAQGVGDPTLGGLLVGIGVFVVLVFGGGAIMFAWVVGRRAIRLDEAFKPLGLEGRMYMVNGRRYQGMIAGRQVEVTFSRGPMLNLSMEAATGTRMAVGTRTGVGTALGRALGSELATGDPAFEGRAASAHDETWARALFAAPGARDIILRLTEDVGLTELRTLLIQPQAVRLQLSYTGLDRITEPSMRAAFDDLLALARIAEGLPAPAERLEGSVWESVEGRVSAQRRVAWIVIGVIGGLSVLGLLVMGATLLVLFSLD